MKSSASARDFAEFIAKSSAGGYSRLYFVVHTPLADFTDTPDNVEVLLPDKIAEKVVDLGLTGWLMKKIQ